MGIFDNEREEQLKADALRSNDILVKDLDGDNVIIGFINSEGNTEYTIYRAIDGGSFDMETSLEGSLADIAGFTEYQTFNLKET